jgi:nitroreductase
MDAFDAIRKRRAVRKYTDAPVDDATVDRLLRLALSAPTGGGAQNWSLLVVRDARKRAELAEYVIDGGARYFTVMRPAKEGVSPDEHLAWAKDYAEQILPSYRHVPVWVMGLLVPNKSYPDRVKDWGRIDDLISLGFAMENLMVAARAEGLGTVPTTQFMRFNESGVRELLGLPDEVEPIAVTPLGHPEAFPEGKPPSLKATFKPWKSLVHDDTWGATRD